VTIDGDSGILDFERRFPSAIEGAMERMQS